MSETERETARHPIRVVSRQTGITADVLRAWEKRYKTVVPARSATGRRLYSDADVERLKLLRQALDAGFSIGHVAALATPELRLRLERDSASPPSGRARAVLQVAPRDLVAAALEAVRALDGARLETVLGESVLALGRTRVVGDVLVPLLHRVGDMWEKGELRPVHEHLASSSIRSLVAAIGSWAEVPSSAPRLVATTPAGQLHEMGALLVASVASSLGWASTYLGPNLPAEDVAAAATQLGARAVALSVVYPSTDPRLPSELRRLRGLLSPSVALLVGGAGAEAHPGLLAEIGAVVVRAMSDLPGVLAAEFDPRSRDQAVGPLLADASRSEEARPSSRSR